MSATTPVASKWNLKRYLAPPVFQGDEDKTRVAGLLHVLLLALSGIILIFATIEMILTRPDIVLLGTETMGFVYLSLWVMMRTGRVRLASVLTLLLFWISTTMLIYLSGTTRTTITGFYIVCVVIAGLLLGNRGTAVFAALSLAALGGLLQAELAGLLPPYTPQPVNISNWFTYAGIIAVIAVLLGLSTRSLTEALGRVRRSNRELQASQEALEQRVIERTRAEEALRRQSDYLTALQSLINSGLEVTEVLQAIIARAGALVGTEHGYIYLLEPGATEMEMRVGVGLYKDLVGSHTASGRGLAGLVWHTGQRVVVDDYQTWPERLQATGREVLRAVIGVPLTQKVEASKTKEQVVGVIGLAHIDPDRRFGDEQIAVLNQFAQLASIALSNARAYEQQATLAAENRQLLERSSQAIEELNALTRRLTGEVWEKYLTQQALDLTVEDVQPGWNGNGHNLPELQEVSAHPGSVVQSNNGHSALALPITLRGQVIGALGIEGQDAQQHWSQDDINAINDVARQMAIALDNARLLEEQTTLAEENRQLLERAEQAVKELNALTQRLTGEGWNQYLSTQTRELVVQDGRLNAGEAQPLSELGKAVETASVVTAHNGHSAIALPIVLRGQVIGAMGLEDDEPNRQWNQDEIAVMQDVVEQMALALDNARLYNETQQELYERTIAQRRLNLQYTAVRVLTEAETLEAAALPLLQAVCEALGWNVGEFWKLDTRANLFRCVNIWTTGGEQFERFEQGVRAMTFKPGEGLTGRVWASGEPLWIPDVLEDAGFKQKDAAREAGIHGAFGFPLFGNGQVVGVICFFSEAIQQRDDELLQLMATTGNQIGQFVSSKQNEAETQRRNEELATLNRVNATVTSSLDLRDLLKATAREMVTIFKARNTGIALLNPAKTELTVVADAVAETHEQSAVGILIPVTDNPSSQEVIETARTLVIENAQTDPRTSSIHERMKQRETHCLMIVPLLAGGDVIGTIGIDSTDPQRVFTEEERALAETIAGQIAGAIENRRLFEQIQDALEEAETLYKASSRMSAATDLQEIVAAVAEGVHLPVINRAVLFGFDYNAQGEMEAAVATAQWYSGTGTPPTPIGRRYPKKIFDTINLAQGREPIFFDDAQNDPRADENIRAVYKALNVRALATLPLWAGTRQLGILILEAEEVHHFTEREIRPYTALAQQMAIAIDNKQLFAQTQAALAETEQLYHATRRLGAANNLHEIVSAFAEAAPNPDLTRAVLFTFERDNAGKATAMVSVANWYSGKGQPPSPIGTSFDTSMFDSIESLVPTEPVFNNDTQTSTDIGPRTKAVFAQMQMGAYAALPLRAGARDLGVILLVSETPHVFTDAERRPYTALAQQAAIALDNRQLFAQTQATLADLRNVTTNVHALLWYANVEVDPQNENNLVWDIHALDDAAAQEFFPVKLEPGQRYADAWHWTKLPEDRARLDQYSWPFVREGKGYTQEFRCIGTDGKLYWMSEDVQNEPLGPNKWRLFGVVTDITARKQAEQLETAVYRIAETANTVKSDNEFYAAIHQIVGELMYAKNFYVAIYDEATDQVTFPYYTDEQDPQNQPLQGVRAGRGVTDYVLHTGQPLLATDEVFAELEARGEIRLVGARSLDWLGVPLKRGNKPFGILAVQTYDETNRLNERDKELLTLLAEHIANAVERKRAEQALRESEERFRAIASAAPIPLQISRARDGMILYVNEKMEETFGYPPGEMVGNQTPSLYYNLEEDRPKVLEILRRDGILKNYELPVRRADGSSFWVSFSSQSLFYNGEPAYLSGYYDITERKRTEEKLRQQAEYLAALHETTLGLVSRLDVKELLEAMVTRAGALMGTPHGYIYLRVPGATEMEMRVGVGAYANLVGARTKRGVGLSGTVWETGQALAVDDYRAWPGRMQSSGRDILRGVVGLPLQSGGEVVGVLGLAYLEEGRKFGANEIEVLERFAHLAAVALDNAQLLQETQAHAEEVAAVNEMARAITQQLNQEELFDTVYRQVHRLMPLDGFHISILDEQTGFLRYPITYDLGERYVDPNYAIEPASASKQVLETGQYVIIHRTRDEMKGVNDPQNIGTIAGAIGSGKVTASRLYVPLRLGNKITGIMSAQSYDFDVYGSREIALLTNIANHVAIALENTRLFEQTQERAEEVAAINEVARAIAAENELDPLFQTVYEQVHRLLGMDAFFVTLYDAASNTIYSPFVYDSGQRYHPDPSPVAPTRFVKQCIDSAAPVLIHRTREELATLQLKAAEAIGDETKPSACLLFVPLRLGNQVIGVVSAQSYTVNAYGERELALLDGIASYVAIAIDKTRLFEQTQQRVSELALVNRISQAISSELQVHDLLKSVVDEVCRTFGVDDGYIALLWDPLESTCRHASLSIL